jgi:hypothetical protein
MHERHVVLYPCGARRRELRDGGADDRLDHPRRVARGTWPAASPLPRHHGHRLTDGDFDPGMLELQKQFATEVLLPYVTQAWLPIGNLKNPEAARDLPDRLVIRPGG